MSSVISKITLTAVCISSLMNASDKPLKIAAANLYANTRNHTVLHDKDGFSVNGQRVKQEDLSKDLRGISGGALKRLFEKDKALRVSRIGNDYGLDTQNRVKGGGPVGAWLGGWIGYGSVMTGAKLLTAGITYGTFLVCPPAAPFVGALADTVVTVVAQPIAVTAAVGGSLAGAVITGPA